MINLSPKMWSLFSNFMAWLGITMSPVELPWGAAEAWQLGFQDAATQGTEILLFFFLLYIVILFSFCVVSGMRISGILLYEIR